MRHGPPASSQQKQASQRGTRQVDLQCAPPSRYHMIRGTPVTAWILQSAPSFPDSEPDRLEGLSDRDGLPPS